MKYLLILSLPLLLSSCFYSINYIASYQVEKGKKTQIQEKSRELFTKDNNAFFLSEDLTYLKTDTIVFHGAPYHTFKIWVDTAGNEYDKINLKYFGAFGSRRKPPYEKMLEQYTDTLKRNFKVFYVQIDKKSNSK